MRRSQFLAALVFIISLCVSPFEAKKHVFNVGDIIPVIVDKVSPRANPSETYSYFKLPFCGHDQKIEKEHQGIGDTITGVRRVHSMYTLQYQTSVHNKELCTQTFSKDEVKKLYKAIKSQDIVHMEIDALPLKHEIGRMEAETAFVFTHLNFLAKYNGDRIVEVDVRPDTTRVQALHQNEAGVNVKFTFSVTWEETSKPFKNRMDKYRAILFPEELEIQWFSIINSGVLVLLLTAFLAFIMMRILKRDYQQYTSAEEEEDEDETGWKLISGHVFRFPGHKNLLAAFLGTGVQLLLLATLLLTLSAVKLVYPHTKGQLYTAIIVVHALTASVAGYVSGSFYKQMGCDKWVHNVLLTVTVAVGPLFLTFCCLNTVAMIYRSSAALPFGTILGILAIYLLVTFPLTLLGAIAGKNFAKPFEAPCRTKKVPRDIPPSPWYRGWISHILIAGFLPFSAIYVELYYVFKSFWGDKLYTPFGLLWLVFVILLMVTASITITLTYLQLSMENYRWWWRSFVSGGATSFFILAYSVFYLYGESNMEGFFQVSFYFGYMLIISYYFFLILGSVGFYASLVFVKSIYKAIKVD